MITVKIEGLQAALNDLKDLQDKVPSIAARTITEVSKDMQFAVQQALPQRLDRPTPWTVKNIQVLAALKADLTAGIVFTHEGGFRVSREQLKRREAPRSMRMQTYGGIRQQKYAEKTLMNAGILPANGVMVPAIGAKRDRYGNVQGGYVTKVLYSGVKGGTGGRGGWARPLGGIANQRTGERYFIRHRNESTNTDPIGIYQDMGKNKPPMPIFLFVKQAKYKMRVPFDAIARRTADKMWRKRFDESVAVVRRKYGR